MNLAIAFRRRTHILKASRTPVPASIDEVGSVRCSYEASPIPLGFVLTRSKIYQVGKSRPRSATWRRWSWSVDQAVRPPISKALSRSYRDQSGDWQRTSYFDESDLDDVLTVVEDAIAYLNPSPAETPDIDDSPHDAD